MLNKFKVFLIGLTFYFLTTSIINAKNFPTGYPECWKDSKNPIVLNPKSSNQFCPLNTKLGHKFFLVDFTSPLKLAQVDWIKGRIFGDTLIKTTPPYHKISYMKIDDTPPQSQVINYSKCRAKSGNKSKFPGEETNNRCEGDKQIKEVFDAWKILNTKFENNFIKANNIEGKQSLIFEYFFHVLREAKIDFTPDYPERELIIVSDLMQYSKRFSFYNHCKTNLEIVKPNKCKSFANLIKNKKVKNYIDDRKPNKQTLKNLKVTVLYINHDYETRDGLSSSLVKLWEDLFNYIGVDNYEVIKQLDIQ